MTAPEISLDELDAHYDAQRKLSPESAAAIKAQYFPTGDSTNFRDEEIKITRELYKRAQGHLVQSAAGAVLTCVATIKPVPISWLWPGRFARGKVSMIAGDPGLGKSLTTLDMTARCTRGSLWPVDRVPAPQGDVILLSAEDDAADTIRPRLDAAGADPNRVHLLEAVRDINEDGAITTRTFSLRRDLDRLSESLAQLPECVLVVIDPVSAYLDGTDSHNNADVRSMLAPLSDLASRHRVAIVCVTHLNKASSGNAMYRMTGSLAFVAAARAAVVVTKDPDDPARRLVLPVKNNLGADTLGLAYRVQVNDTGAVFVEWEPDAVATTAEDALLPAPDEERGEREEAVDWLNDLLSAGPLSAKEVQTHAKQSGLAWRTVRRAKDAIGIKPAKTRFDGGWEWSLPSKVSTKAEGVHTKRQDTFEKVGHLGTAETCSRCAGEGCAHCEVEAHVR